MSLPLQSCFFYGMYLHSPCAGKVDSRMIGDDDKGYETVDLCDSHLTKQQSGNPLSFNPISKSRPRIDTLRGIPKASSIPPPSALAPNVEAPSQYILIPQDRIARKLAQRNVDSLVMMVKKLTPADRLAILEHFCVFCGHETHDCQCKA